MRMKHRCEHFGAKQTRVYKVKLYRKEKGILT